MTYACLFDVVSKYEDMALSHSASPVTVQAGCHLYIKSNVPECVCWDSANVQCVLTMLLSAAAKQIAHHGNSGRVAVIVSCDGNNQLVIEVRVEMRWVFA